MPPYCYLLSIACLASLLAADAAAQQRPGLFFREDWKQTPAETPISQKHVANENLVLRLYGPGRDQIKKSHHDKPDDDPYYVWSGLCEGNWAVTLAHRDSAVDLSGQAKIRWRTRQEGHRRLHVIVRVAEGAWLVSNAVDEESHDWRAREVIFANLSWRELDIETVAEGRRVESPDLTRVVEIGFTDLMRGGGSRACSRLDWIEVYGRPAPGAGPSE